MDFLHQHPLMITVGKKGPEKRAKQTFPRRLYRYSEIRTQGFEFCFSPNGAITTIRGLNPDWPHPAEHFKRTAGNDWVYYTVGDKSGSEGIISWMGEYYLPCLPYSSNPVWEVKYFSNPVIMSAMAAWSQLYANLYMANEKGRYPRAAGLVERILNNDDTSLYESAQRLNRIIGERISVLPPDTRHVDYDVIPVNIADGCLYHCKFCCVKSEKKFKKRSKESVSEQIAAIKDHFGENMINYHALFIGNHDALAAGDDLICFAAKQAYESFGFGQRVNQKPVLYVFGSVDSFLRAEKTFFDNINELPFYSYINIGFESVDPGTLDKIGKPITAEKVKEAFRKKIEINHEYDQIEVTGNFVIGDNLAPEHNLSLAALLRDAPVESKAKGCVYLSPLKDSPKKRELLQQFNTIKQESKLPVLVYLIQRL